MAAIIILIVIIAVAASGGKSKEVTDVAEVDETVQNTDAGMEDVEEKSRGEKREELKEKR